MQGKEDLAMRRLVPLRQLIDEAEERGDDSDLLVDPDDVFMVPDELADEETNPDELANPDDVEE